MPPLRRFFRHPRPSSGWFPSALAAWVACVASLASSTRGAESTELTYQIEHDVMALEWLRRCTPKVDEHMKTYLFTKGDILKIEEKAK